MKDLYINYSTWKTIFSKVKSYYTQLSDGYMLYSCGDEYFMISQVYDSGDVSEFESTYKSQCDEAGSRDDAFVAGLVENDVPFVVKRQSDGVVLTSNAPRVGYEDIIISHNYCDKCTWFEGSVRVSNETLSDSGDHLTFNSQHAYWVDMVSGRVSFQSRWIDKQKLDNPLDQHGYSVVVKVDNVEKTAREPFATSGGDYEIIYEDGNIVFFSEQTGVVTASYSYADKSDFTIVPPSGKKVRIEYSEIDLSTDIIMNDKTEQLVYGYAGVYAPDYSYMSIANATFSTSSSVVTGSGFSGVIQPGMYVRNASDDVTKNCLVVSVDSDSQITIHQNYGGTDGQGSIAYSTSQTSVYPYYYQIVISQTDYHRVSNFTQEANASYPQIQAVGSSSSELLLGLDEFRRKSRGMKSSILPIVSKYNTVKELDSASGNKMVVRLANDEPYSGEVATITFYSVIE